MLRRTSREIITVESKKEKVVEVALTRHLGGGGGGRQARNSLDEVLFSLEHGLSPHLLPFSAKILVVVCTRIPGRV